MAETSKLKLPKLTGNMSWDVVRDMNALADAIDGKVGEAGGIPQLDEEGKLSAEHIDIESGEIASKTELSNLKTDVGNPDDLSTETKTSVVDAVNELEQKSRDVGREITQVNQTVTTHLLPNAPDAHNISNITGLQSAIDKKQDILPVEQKRRVFIQSTAPDNPLDGDIWIVV